MELIINVLGEMDESMTREKDQLILGINPIDNDVCGKHLNVKSP